jgi:hypothetical protein
MKILVAKVATGGDLPAGCDSDKQLAENGEPVFPSFPFITPGRFIGIRSGGYAYEAVPAESADDPDKWLDVLAARYPGLPRLYLSAILVYTLVAANGLRPGHRYRALVTATEAKLQDVESGDLIPIWTEMNTEKYLG